LNGISPFEAIFGPEFGNSVQSVGWGMEFAEVVADAVRKRVAAAISASGNPGGMSADGGLPKD
jgi:hypothetical protein